jgi:ABC-type polar amino acid transport system ATPase subunit
MTARPSPVGTLVVSDLHVQRGSVAVLRGVSFTASVGEIVAVMGVSGAGKTTVLRTVAALEPFTAGAIDACGVPLMPGTLPSESRLRALRSRVGVVFQSNALFEHLTVLQNVTLAPVHALKWTAARANEVAHALLASLGVEVRAHALPRQLSGGEAQRVAIARALAPNPQLLLMDEPTSALDPARRGALGELLRTLAAEGRGIVVVTHDVEFASAYAHRVVVLAEGRVVEAGPARQVLEHSTHEATRALLSQQH